MREAAERDRALLNAQAERLGVVLSGAAIDRLLAFAELLQVWNQKFRLLGDRRTELILRKHVPDSLALVPLVVQGPLADIGSGAGFPGLVVACVRPDLDVYLIESRRRPATFLTEAAGRLGLRKVRVVAERAEVATAREDIRGRMRVVTGRAVALRALLTLASPALAPDGVVIALQGPSMTDERVGEVAQSQGMKLVLASDYTLPDGERRRLVAIGSA